VIPALQRCRQRVDVIDAALQEEQEEQLAIEPIRLRQQLTGLDEG
jgi:hypothetical protein